MSLVPFHAELFGLFAASRYSLARDMKANIRPTTAQAAKLAERRNALRKKVTGWLRQEARCFPHRIVVAPNAFNQDQLDDAPETIPLPLPSTFSTLIRQDAYPAAALIAEWDLRWATAHEALVKLRRKLRVRSFLNRWRRSNVRGQVPSTRMRSLQAQVDEHV